MFVTVSRLDHFEVRVGSNFSEDTFHPSSYELCASHNQIFAGGVTLHLPCITALRGRYVVVTIPDSQFLTICEVQVYGEHGRCRKPKVKETN